MQLISRILILIIATTTQCRAQEVPCYAGEYRVTSTDPACIKCPAGSYKQYLSTDPCTLCPKNQTTRMNGRTNPNDCECDKGYYGVRRQNGADGLSCTLCAEGTYKLSVGSIGVSSCVACTDNAEPLSTPPPVFVNRCICHMGYIGISRTGVCIKCPAGYSTATTGSEACQCNIGYSGPDTFFREISDDYQDYYLRYTGAFDEISLFSYMNNYTGPANSKCTSCPEGTSNTGMGQPCQCKAGYGGIAPNCSLCSPATFKADVGNGDCLKCGSNQESHIGSTRESDCVTTCGFGYYNDNKTCIECPAETYTPTSITIGLEGCTRCPENSTTFGSTKARTCTCMPGYTSANMTSQPPCFACAAGKFWSNFSCNDCPAGTSSQMAGADSIDKCKHMTQDTADTANNSLTMFIVLFGIVGGVCVFGLIQMCRYYFIATANNNYNVPYDDENERLYHNGYSDVI